MHHGTERRGRGRQRQAEAGRDWDSWWSGEEERRITDAGDQLKSADIYGNIYHTSYVYLIYISLPDGDEILPAAHLGLRGRVGGSVGKAAEQSPTHAAPAAHAALISTVVISTVVISTVSTVS